MHRDQFLDNKYTKWYFSIIENARRRSIDGYTEKHHIVPRAIGGTDKSDNKVALLPREHFVCHMLLPKMLTGIAAHKMIYALDMLSKVKNIGNGRHKAKSHQYAVIRKKISEARKAYWTAEKRAAQRERSTQYMNSLSIDERKARNEKISRSSMNKQWSEKAIQNRLANCLKSAELRKGTKQSQDQILKRVKSINDRKTRLGPRKFSDEARKNISKALMGTARNVKSWVLTNPNTQESMIVENLTQWLRDNEFSKGAGKYIRNQDKQIIYHLIKL